MIKNSKIAKWWAGLSDDTRELIHILILMWIGFIFIYVEWGLNAVFGIGMLFLSGVTVILHKINEVIEKLDDRKDKEV